MCAPAKNIKKHSRATQPADPWRYARVARSIEPKKEKLKGAEVGRPLMHGAPADSVNIHMNNQVSNSVYMHVFMLERLSVLCVLRPS